MLLFLGSFFFLADQTPQKKYKNTTSQKAKWKAGGPPLSAAVFCVISLQCGVL